MKPIRTLFAAVLFTIAAGATAGPIPVNEYNFTNGFADTGSKPRVLNRIGGTVGNAGTAPALPKARLRCSTVPVFCARLTS